ncbi:hypothetical protein LAZ67_3005816 [Cordylochernes scorpioides]|uniref:Uncharacterized protein n=1 Tax=Cordylochernes scorpioides TaxID=51811 RepID=A0ABY6KBN6_9ARAC|nr:hypothetical protein LAZ67_3005816 [Cordylochernes scorpioides]
MDVKNAWKWWRKFSEGQENVHDEQRSGRPSLPELTVARINEMVHNNQRITLHEMWLLLLAEYCVGGPRLQKGIPPDGSLRSSLRNTRSSACKVPQNLAGKSSTIFLTA